MDQCREVMSTLCRNSQVEHNWIKNWIALTCILKRKHNDNRTLNRLFPCVQVKLKEFSIRFSARPLIWYQCRPYFLRQDYTSALGCHPYGSLFRSFLVMTDKTVRDQHHTVISLLYVTCLWQPPGKPSLALHHMLWGENERKQSPHQTSNPGLWGNKNVAESEAV